MTEIRYYLVLCTALLISSCTLFPVEITPTVSGRVIDANTQQPVYNAKVYFLEFPQEAVNTSSSGEFMIETIRKWQLVVVGTDINPDHALVVEANGYRTEQWNYFEQVRPQLFELQADGMK